MKIIQIPTSNDPLIVTINNQVYSYHAGETVEVPDDVAAAIEDALALVPKPKIHLSKFGSLVNKSITELTPDDFAGITEIGNYAFSYCMALTKVSFGDSVRTIGVSAFAYCYALKSIVIPDTITTIATYAFSKCTALTDITIGRGVTSIAEFAFNLVGKSKTATYRLLSTTPPAIAADAIHADSLAKIIVPKGCGEVYKAATHWSTFADYIEEAK